ncbi:mis12-Mtw1 protein family protein [Hirsutella rhossiliensis]|uniref:Mis12-Mtw1 protein family domain-containing protein n=1 Tax=Hirsutella rhossiliensis TaxID=111463 RepID=A0A9P8MSQ5_9HYPO|nr:mis12-Mtw1 protein family domain-containing protein [Hirsutella rhossiliensis]KAH0959531.1 mis12-Mtw1 protein family domain-containing protein [Hirsutella rhossiliensis]
MTTLVATRQALELLSMSDHQKRRTSKRLAAAAEYEQDDDFQFVRKSKRAKTDEQEPAKKPARGRPPAKGKAAKESITSTSTPRAAAAAAAAPAATTAPGTRRSSRRKASFDAQQDELQPPVPKRATRQSKRLSGDAIVEEIQLNGATRKSRGRPKASRISEEAVESPQQQAPPVESAKIALPMSDTPIINRNKEMRRKGNSNRRSSLGSRGRRASSLIENGQTAIPHREVDAAEFYKHIEAEGLPEPRRMKQLLMWCGERALAAKPPHGTPNSNAILGARAIQDQLLKDFASRSEFSDWFSRDDTVPEPRTVARKPNPRNIELDEKVASLEGKIQRLKEEKKAWLAIRKLPPEQPPLFAPDETDTITLPDFDLLDPDEGKIRGYLADERNSFATVRSETEGRLRKIQSSLEFEVDQLADNVHKLEQRVLVAGKEADRLLKISAVRLREREQRERTSTGTRDMPIMEVLRSLSSILPEGNGG